MNPYLEKVAEMNKAEKAGYGASGVLAGGAAVGTVANAVHRYAAGDKISKRYLKAEEKNPNRKNGNPYEKNLNRLSRKTAARYQVLRKLGKAGLYAGAVGAAGSLHRAFVE